jgi:NADH-quinone oxidoreductase subunit L
VLVSVVVIPLVGFLVNLAGGRRLPKALSGGVACVAMLAAFAAAGFAVRDLVARPPDTRVVEQTLYTWMAAGDLHVPFTLRLDPLGAVLLLVVTGVGFLIHVYSLGYMHEESAPEYARYFSYLNLFAAFMLLLVLGGSLPVFFVGWEGVGLCSYLLIGFSFYKPAAADAGKKAFIVNRVGDFAFLVGMLLAFREFGTLDIATIADRVAARRVETTFGPLSLLTLLLFVGATGKSAQVPLHVWLPDAMEGPTPVSALIHAATMVTAGVFMIGRNAALFAHTPLVLELVAIVGVTTAVFAGTIGLAQYDIKRILAYSTISQLGLMVTAMGVGAFAAGIFHLFTHAFFKALLFLGAGAVIHALAGEQDIRRMGGLREPLPLTYWTFLIGAAALAGVPLLAGFFSKDAILVHAFESGHRGVWLAALAASLLTALYMFRLVFLAFHGPFAAGATAEQAVRATNPASHAAGLHDPPPSMAMPLVVLAAGSILAGYLGVPPALGGADRIARFLEPSFAAAERTLAEPVPGEVGLEGAPAGEATAAWRARALMGVATAVALGGIAVAAVLFLARRDLAAALATRWSGLHRWMQHKYYVDEFYDAVFVQPIKRLATGVLWRRVDAGLIDGAISMSGAAVVAAGGSLRRLQSGSIRQYALALLVGAVLIVGYYMSR